MNINISCTQKFTSVSIESCKVLVSSRH